MSTPRITALAHVVAKPDHVAYVRTVLTDVVLATRQESGCLSYRLCQHTTNPAEFTTVEEWTDEGSEEAHCLSAHVLAALSKLNGRLAAAPDIRRYRTIT
ncbi:MAG: putative quinol monooxygenase [Nitrospiraceae bacterium]